MTLHTFLWDCFFLSQSEPLIYNILMSFNAQAFVGTHFYEHLQVNLKMHFL
jgi:hypothetical protein